MVIGIPIMIYKPKMIWRPYQVYYGNPYANEIRYFWLGNRNSHHKERQCHIYIETPSRRFFV